MNGDHQRVILQNNCHFMPISARIHYHIQTIGTCLMQSASNRWHGRVIRTFAQIFNINGMFFNTFVAITEAVIGFTLAIFSSIACTSMSKNSLALQKFTRKCWSYTIHSIIMVAVQMKALSNNVFPRKYHTLNLILHNKKYLFTNFFVQSMRKDAEELGDTLLVEIIKENLPKAIPDFIWSLKRDFGGPPSRYAFLRPEIRKLAEELPKYLKIIQEVGENGFEHINGLTEILEDLKRAFPKTMGSHEVVLSSNSRKDDQYQKKLVAYIKSAFQKIIKNAEYVRLFGTDPDQEKAYKEGYEVLSECDAITGCTRLAYMAQVEEIRNRIECPTSFGNKELSQYNNRCSHLLSVQKKWRELSEDEQEYVILKLLGKTVTPVEAGDYPLRDKLKKAFEEIGKLSIVYHQSKLINVPLINIFSLEISSKNLFYKAWEQSARKLKAIQN